LVLVVGQHAANAQIRIVAETPLYFRNPKTGDESYRKHLTIDCRVGARDIDSDHLDTRAVTNKYTMAVEGSKMDDTELQGATSVTFKCYPMEFKYVLELAGWTFSGTMALMVENVLKLSDPNPGPRDTIVDPASEEGFEAAFKQVENDSPAVRRLIATHGEIPPHLRRRFLVVFTAAAVLGGAIVGGIVGSMFGGGNDAVFDKLGDMSKALREQNQAMERLQETQQKFNRQTLARFANQDKQNKAMGEAIDGVKGATEANRMSINALKKYTTGINSRMTEQFNLVNQNMNAIQEQTSSQLTELTTLTKTEIEKLGQNDNKLKLALNALATEVQQDLTDLGEVAASLMEQQRQLTDLFFDHHTRRYERSEMSLAAWNVINDLTNDPNAMWTPFLGTRANMGLKPDPAYEGEYASKGMRLDAIDVMYWKEGGTDLARRRFDVMCNVDFAIDNAREWTKWSDILRWVGPTAGQPISRYDGDNAFGVNKMKFEQWEALKGTINRYDSPYFETCSPYNRPMPYNPIFWQKMVSYESFVAATVSVVDMDDVIVRTLRKLGQGQGDDKVRVRFFAQRNDDGNLEPLTDRSGRRVMATASMEVASDSAYETVDADTVLEDVTVWDAPPCSCWVEITERKCKGREMNWEDSVNEYDQSTGKGGFVYAVRRKEGGTWQPAKDENGEYSELAPYLEIEEDIESDDTYDHFCLTEVDSRENLRMDHRNPYVGGYHTRYVTSLDELEDEFGSLCTTPLEVGKFVVRSGDRLANTLNNQFLVPQDNDKCKTDVKSILAQAADGPTLPFAILNALTVSFRVIIRKVREMRLRKFGAVPNDIIVSENPFMSENLEEGEYDADLDATVISSFTARFGATAGNMIPIFRMRILDVIKRVEMTWTKKDGSTVVRQAVSPMAANDLQFALSAGTPIVGDPRCIVSKVCKQQFILFKLALIGCRSHNKKYERVCAVAPLEGEDEDKNCVKYRECQTMLESDTHQPPLERSFMDVPAALATLAPNAKGRSNGVDYLLKPYGGEYVNGLGWTDEARAYVVADKDGKPLRPVDNEAEILDQVAKIADGDIDTGSRTTEEWLSDVHLVEKERQRGFSIKKLASLTKERQQVPMTLTEWKELWGSDYDPRSLGNPAYQYSARVEDRSETERTYCHEDDRGVGDMCTVMDNYEMLPCQGDEYLMRSVCLVARDSAYLVTGVEVPDGRLVQYVADGCPVIEGPTRLPGATQFMLTNTLPVGDGALTDLKVEFFVSADEAEGYMKDVSNPLEEDPYTAPCFQVRHISTLGEGNSESITRSDCALPQTLRITNGQGKQCGELVEFGSNNMAGAGLIEMPVNPTTMHVINTMNDVIGERAMNMATELATMETDMLTKFGERMQTSLTEAFEPFTRGMTEPDLGAFTHLADTIQVSSAAWTEKLNKQSKDWTMKSGEADAAFNESMVMAQDYYDESIQKAAVAREIMAELYAEGVNQTAGMNHTVQEMAEQFEVVKSKNAALVESTHALEQAIADNQGFNFDLSFGLFGGLGFLVVIAIIVLLWCMGIIDPIGWLTCKPCKRCKSNEPKSKVDQVAGDGMGLTDKMRNQVLLLIRNPGAATSAAGDETVGLTMSRQRNRRSGYSQVDDGDSAAL
jgi:hypothetical protein